VDGSIFIAKTHYFIFYFVSIYNATVDKVSARLKPRS